MTNKTINTRMVAGKKVKTKQTTVSSLHPFDYAYTIAFIIILTNYFSWVIFHTAIQTKIVFNLESLFRICISILLSAQLLRMYYHLKDFELTIAKLGASHFLEVLPFKYSYRERVVRIILAAILVLYSKIGNFEYVPSVTLSVCFILLIIWDFIVWVGLKKILNKPNEQIWITARRFFYLSSKYSAPNNLGKYIRNRKFWERICGLMASIIAFAFSITMVSHLFWIFLLFAILVPGITIYGHYKSNLKGQVEPTDFWTPFFMPFYYIFAIRNINNEDMNIKIKNPPNGWKIAAISILFLLIFGFCLKHCYFDNRDDKDVTKTENEKTKIKIATSKNLWCTLTLVALDRGFFQAEGLEPQMNYQAAGRLNMDALIGGTVDFANVVETNIAYQALNKTKDLKIHGRIVSATDYAILTRGSSLIKNEKDFIGKTISYAQATGAESFVFWFLEKEKISPTLIKLYPLQPTGLVDNFLGGNGDAVATWEPFVSTIENRSKNLGKIFRTDSNGFTGIMTVATKQTWASQNPTIINAYDNAMIRAAQFVKDSIEVAQKIVSKQSGLPLTTVISAWTRFDFRYNKNLGKEKMLVDEVIRRIKIMVPEKSEIIPESVDEYFKSKN